MIGRRRAHDPERHAAAYVSGELSGRARRWFEVHLLECEDCWREVRVGREGRRIAERVRELAPPGLRDDVRAAVLLSESRSRRRLPSFLGVVVLVTLVGGTVVGLTSLRGERQPVAIEAALASYRSGATLGLEPAREAPDLSADGLQLVSSGRASLGEIEADAFAYRDASGAKVLVLLSSSVFPQARDATEQSGTLGGWHARDGGLALLCGSRPVSYLLVGERPSLLRAVEEALTGDGGTVAVAAA
ncbi:MAG: zf-HC2 domain-containing protein [Actinomycetota bacterium]